MNTQSKLLSTLTAFSLAFGLSYADTAEEEDMIITSKPHSLPRLMTLQTSEVLESYAIGFAGSGNVHNIMKGRHDALNGAIYLGLGDVAELGYDMEEVRMKDETVDKRMKGHIKIQLLSESTYIPAMGFTYGANISDAIEIGNKTPFAIDRQSFIFGMSKSLQIGNYRVSVHPGFVFQFDRMMMVGDSTLKSKNRPSEKLPSFQLGATWQTTENTVFILESHQVPILNQDNASNFDLSYSQGFENNLGVRFYLRNWIFIDAGIRSLYDTEAEMWETGIHANITGLIPMKSVGERIMNNFQ